MNEIIDLLAISHEELSQFVSNPDLIAISVEEFQTPLIELLENAKLPRLLRSGEDVYAACCAVYAVSEDGTEPEEQQPLLEKAAKLALSVFDQKISKFPITFVSAFTVVVSKLSEVKSDGIKQLIEVLLSSIQLGDDESSKSIVCNFLMELMSRSYQMLSQKSLMFIVEFLSHEGQLFKLIEVICMGYSGSTIRKIEEEVTSFAFKELKQCVNVDEDIFPLVHEFIIEISSSSHEEYIIEHYFLVFLEAFAMPDIHNIIAGLLCTSHKVIGVKLAEFYLEGSSVNEKQFIFVLENLVIHLKSCDDQYLASICGFVENALQHDTVISEAHMLYFSNVGYRESVIALSLLSLTLLSCSKRLATHMREVSASITTRKFVVDFYGCLLLRPQIVSEFDAAITNMEEIQRLEKLVESLGFKNEELTALLKQEFSALQAYLVIPMREFCLQELKVRLEDDSELVKRCALARLVNYLQNDPTQIGILFTDMLLVEDEPQLSMSCFEEFVVRPIEEEDLRILNSLFTYLEECPIKLFESTFAVFLKDIRVQTKNFMFLAEENRMGAYIILKMLVQYTEQEPDRVYQRVADMVRVKLIENYETGEAVYEYALYCFGAPQLRECADFDVRQFEPPADANSGQFEFEELIIDEEVAEIKNSRAYFEELSMELKDLLDLEQKTYNSGLHADLDLYLQQGEHIYSRIISCIQHQVSASQAQLDSLIKYVEPQLFYHPMACIVLYYLLYASQDIEFRLGLFEKLLNLLSNISSMNSIEEVSASIANNALIAAFSAIYQYPDELGQFTGLIIDNDCVRGNCLIERHMLYIIMDLYQLSLIKMDFSTFNSIFGLLLSPNEDLRALAERLLLNLKFNIYFVKFFRLCMSELKDCSAFERQGIYIKIMARLDQVSKYELLNQFLETLPTSTELEALDLFTLIESGAVTLTISEEYEKATSVLKRLNTQYTVESVLPRLMERLCHYNAEKAGDLQLECIQAIEAVCEQMHVEYEELASQFGSEYCLELLQIKW